jgi:protein subunit release factor B
MTRGSKPSEKLIDLQKRMRKLGIFEKDIKEQFVTSPGPGGQNVNKVATRVVLKHIPTGIIVKCSEKRTQAANRHQARHTLIEKIARQLHEIEILKTKKLEQERRRNRRPSSVAKEHMLHDKHYHSEVKQLRKMVRPVEVENE